MKRILVVAAHPDDEVLGCGGTIARLVREGYDANVLILGEGITSRDEQRDVMKRKTEIEELRREMHESAKIIGIRDVSTYAFPDNRFDTVALLDIVKVVETAIDSIQPHILFTHYEKDLNIDHQLTFKAVSVAARPVKTKPVKEFYSFKILSSTDWVLPLSFAPNVFFDISDTLDVKVKAATAYRSELRDFPHPRSVEGIKIDAQYWGMCSGCRYAEAFECIRVIS